MANKFLFDFLPMPIRSTLPLEIGPSREATMLMCPAQEHQNSTRNDSQYEVQDIPQG